MPALATDPHLGTNLRTAGRPFVDFHHDILAKTARHGLSE